VPQAKGRGLPPLVPSERPTKTLLDAMRGPSALNETTTESGESFAHGECTPMQFRVDSLGVCRLVPLTPRHYVSEYEAPPREALGFLSPERLIAEKVGLRADVFSAGVLLWEALAGRRLIDGDYGI
jgi:eukaryotic-like serine/threonine-protein kinase